MNSVLVLNADYQPLNFVSIQRAMCLIAKEKVEVVKSAAQKILNSEGKEYPVPSIIRLIKLIRTVYKTGVPFSRRNLAVRDRYTCQYCGKKVTKHYTLDHIFPKSRGGKTTWENSVLSCRDCNTKKDNRTPKEANMSLLSNARPHKPTIQEFINLKMETTKLDQIFKDLFTNN